MFAINSLADLSAKTSSRKTSATVTSLKHFEKNRLLYSVQFISLFAYLLWLLLGVLWYKYYNNWTFATAYYYALEAGLSIGFCYPVEKDDASKAFTIIYVLVGSSIIAGSLGALMTQYFYVAVKLRHNDYTSGYLPLKEPISQKYTFTSIKNYVWFEFKLFVGWYHHRARVCCMSAFLIWMALGTAYGIHVEKWTIITSLYWAVTSASTGGLQSANCLPGTMDTTCDLGPLRGILMGTFFVFGVPLYAYAMSHFSGLLIERALEERNYELLSKPIEESEFYYAANILSPLGSQTLNCGEFILFQLIRLGLTNEEQVEIFKADFALLDKNNAGVINIQTFRENKLSKPSKPKKYRNASFEKFAQFISPSKRSSFVDTKFEDEEEEVEVNDGGQQNVYSPAKEVYFRRLSLNSEDSDRPQTVNSDDGGEPFTPLTSLGDDSSNNNNNKNNNGSNGSNNNKLGFSPLGNKASSGIRGGGSDGGFDHLGLGISEIEMKPGGVFTTNVNGNRDSKPLLSVKSTNKNEVIVNSRNNETHCLDTDRVEVANKPDK